MNIIRILFAFLWFKIAERRKESGRSYGTIKVSAIVPTFNEDSTSLYNCVNSLRNQVDEVIVVDDGSTKKVDFNRLFKFFHNVRVIRLEKNQGKKNAEVVGIKETKGDFILFADSDTIFDKDFVKNAMPLIRDEVVVVGDIQISNNTGFNAIMSNVYFNAFSLWRASMSLFCQVPVCSGAGSIYPRNDLLNMWDLTKDLDGQSEELKRFIHSAICK